MSSPNDLENATRLLASQEGTATISKIGRRSIERPERNKNLQKIPTGRSQVKGSPGLPSDGPRELKVDEEAIRELRGLQSEEEEAEKGEAEQVQDTNQPLSGPAPESVELDQAVSVALPPADLFLERDTPASAGPSRGPSPHLSIILGPSEGVSYSQSSIRNALDASEDNVERGLGSSGSGAQAQQEVVRSTDQASDRESEHEEEEDGEESSDEEAEPSLKYQRLKGTVLDVVKKDSISTLAVSENFLALGTHAGMIFIVDFHGTLIKAFKSHTASVLDLEIDTSMEFVAAAGMDGLISISSLTSAEHYAFDFKRPMRAVSLEPNFGRRNTRAFVCGGMAGALILREKGWLGHKETVLHGGEGPIWSCFWKGNLVAWANDKGVRIYDTDTRQRITFINAPQGQVRGDLYRCNLFWQDGRTLIIAWADQIKIAKIREKEAKSGGLTAVGGSSHPQVVVEITKIFQLDCTISGLAPYESNLLVLTYLSESEDDGSGRDDDSDAESSRMYRRKIGQRPELRIINPVTGEERSSDVLSLSGYERLQCNDYHLVPSYDISKEGLVGASKPDATEPSIHALFYVVSPREIIIARPRDHRDHINWLIDQKKFEAALGHIKEMPPGEAQRQGFDAAQIGRDYLSHLTDDLGDYAGAAGASGKILGQDVQAWEEIVFLFLERGQLDKIVDYIPLEDPTLSSIIYDMILAHFLQHNIFKLKEIVNHWPTEIYSTEAVALAIEDRLQSSPVTKRGSIDQGLRPWTVESNSEQTLLMEVLADLYVRNHQPGKSLTFFLRLGRPEIFDLIREHNLFLDIRDQARQLIEFEEAMRRDSVKEGNLAEQQPDQAIQLLVDNVHSIPVQRVVPQLEGKPSYLHLYLDAMFDRDPQLVMEYSDLQIELYADYGYAKLMPYLRGMSSYYSFEKAFRVCELHDYVPEMVFLLGRVGDNKRALNLIIERLNDVSRAIDFAKEQNDDDLWEDLLRYSETRPAFIRGLLENVGAEINPIRLIRHIKDGLDIPGLKVALIKILHDFNLQISLLEGCVSILRHDIRSLQEGLFQGQSQAHYCEPEVITAWGRGSSSVCSACSQPLFSRQRQSDVKAVSSTIAANFAPSIVFLCRHVYHLTCLLPKAGSVPSRRAKSIGANPGGIGTTATQIASKARVLCVQRTQKGDLQTDQELFHPDHWPSQRIRQMEEEFREKIAYSARLRGALRSRGCPMCRSEGEAALQGETRNALTSN